MDMTGAGWRKSSYSGNSGGNCVEVAAGPQAVAVRDSKDSSGPVLAFTPKRWLAFTRRAKSGAADAGLAASYRPEGHSCAWEPLWRA
jgi:hypothetical protein